MKKLFPLIFIALLAACSFGEKKQATNELLEADPIPTYVDYRIQKINQKVGQCGVDASSEKCLLFQIEYPVITGKVSQVVVDNINRQIESEILLNTPVEKGSVNSVEEMVEELTSTYKQLVDDFEDYEQSWLVEINADILYQNEDYISLASTVFNYTGGAHPNNSQIYKSYDLKTGNVITLSDLFVEGYQNTLFQAAEIEFRMQKEIPPQNTLASAGYWFEDDQFELNENFAIINKSLIFYFNPYEIGPYSLGATELELKLTDYVDLIKKNGLLAGLLQDSTAVN